MVTATDRQYEGLDFPMRVVTIDGPAGAGKSSLADGLAARLGWRKLDTGAMYRAVTLAAIRRGLNLNDAETLGELCRTLEIRLRDGRVELNGEDVSAAIRDPEITRNTRFAAGSIPVRTALVAAQRAFAQEFDTVTEGRDQGTIVFPDAIRKYYLTATAESRARRRHAELIRSGVETQFEQVLREVEERDLGDAGRAIAPLKPADDARILESTHLDANGVLALVLDDLQSRGISPLPNRPGT